jgi:hypothetical protein
MRNRPNKYNGGKLASKTWKSQINWMNALSNWAAVQYEWGADWVSPFRKLAPKNKRKDAERRYLAYSPEELRTIFSSRIYASAPLDPRERDVEFWLPLLAIYQGRRVGEITNRLTGDIQRDPLNGIDYINVVMSKDQQQKNVGSLGQYPIHPELIRLGFLLYVNERKARGDTRLFPRVRSSWWGNYREETRITEERKVFHSFRSNWTQTAKNAGVPKELRNALAGRIIGDTEETHYGSEEGYALTLLLPELRKVQFYLDLSRFHVKAETD